MHHEANPITKVITKQAIYADKDNPPKLLRVKPDGIPAELKAERRWVIWKLVWKENKSGTGKWDKLPQTISGRNASSTDPATWSSFDEVYAAYTRGKHTGIGFVLGDGWAGVDLDDVQNPESNRVFEWAEKTVALGGYSEVSPSMTGLKMIGRGKWTADWHRKRHPAGGDVEVYDAGRYFTVTGYAIVCTVQSLDLQPAMDAIAVAFAPPLPPSPPQPPVAPAGGECLDPDDVLIDRIRKSKQGAKFIALHDQGDMSAYGGDESRADMALVAMLAWWCEGDTERIDRLFRGSALMRPKWDSKRRNSTWGRDTIEKVLQGQTVMCSPDGPKKTSVAKSTRTASDHGDGDERDGKQPVAEVLANIAVAESELWHDATGAGFATIGRRTLALRSKGFKQWLTRRFREMTDGKVASGDALNNAVNAVEAMATIDGAEQEAHVRVALHNERVYLHLADADDTVVEVDANGWRGCDKPPVRFRRSPGTRALPKPQPGGRLDDLRDLLGLTDPEQYALVVGFLCGILRPAGPLPVLVLSGEQGSGKSTLTRAIKRLVDPTAAEVRSEPRDPRDLMIATRSNHLLCLENLSEVRPWLSDALCRLSTGGGLATRALYSDEDEAVFDARRPVVVNGIEDLVSRSDLLERAILLYLPTIPEVQRSGEEELWGRFDILLPTLLGALLDRVSGGLRELPRVRLNHLPRMADLVRWAVACEQGAGEVPRFLDAYADNQAAAHAQALDGSSLSEAVRRLVAASGYWEGSATSLYDAIREQAPEYLPTDWPRAPNAVTGPLKRLAPNLRKVHGIEVTFYRSTDPSRSRRIRIRWPAAEEEVKRRPRLPGVFVGSDRTILAVRPCEDTPSPLRVAEVQAIPDDPDGSDGSDGSDNPPQPSRPVSHEEFAAFLDVH